MRPRALRRRLALIGFGGMLICGLATAGLARATCEVTTTITYRPQRDWGYWVSTGAMVALSVAVLALAAFLLVSLIRRPK